MRWDFNIVLPLGFVNTKPIQTKLELSYYIALYIGNVYDKCMNVNTYKREVNARFALHEHS